MSSQMHQVQTTSAANGKFISTKINQTYVITTNFVPADTQILKPVNYTNLWCDYGASVACYFYRESMNKIDSINNVSEWNK